MKNLLWTFRQGALGLLKLHHLQKAFHYILKFDFIVLDLHFKFLGAPFVFDSRTGKVLNKA